MEANLVKRACLKATKAQSEPNHSYIIDTKPEECIIIAFSGTGTLKEWYSVGESPFGDVQVDLKLFPSLKSIGNDQVATVNGKFYQQFRNLLKEKFPADIDACRFEDLLKDSNLKTAVTKAVKKNKRVVFTGYSSGGPIAILATVLFLQQNRIPAWCVTFGSPLVGDKIFGHALRREVIEKENWAHYFLHFVNRYDLIPRVLLSPASSIGGEGSLQSLDPSKQKQQQYISGLQGASLFFDNVLSDASSLASHLACSFMACTNSLLQTVASFIKFSPYRPFGTFAFCTKNGRIFTVKNSDAILQLLFYSLLDNRKTDADIVLRSLQDHLQYGTIDFQSNLGNENQDLLLQLPLSYEKVETFINELGLSQRAMLCLIAARESEKQKERNQKGIDDNREKIRKGLLELEEYKTSCELREGSYYDAFKRQSVEADFKANVLRLELAGIWDEIIEMLKRYALPDGFEGREEWIVLGTMFRRLVEPLDIANYYRHNRDDNTKHYLLQEKGKEPRPKRYRYTQRWLEYAKRKPVGYFSESCFWAEVEWLFRSPGPDQAEKIRILDENVSRWLKDDDKLLGRDVFEKTTFVNWWQQLLPELRSNAAQIAALIEEVNKKLTASQGE